MLTSNGLQPVPPTPGLPLGYLIVYNGTSYGAGVSLTPTSRLTISANYITYHQRHAEQHDPIDQQDPDIPSQLQYRFRRISLLAGYTQFTQGISASGFPAGRDYSFFMGVSRWINFF